MLVLCMCNTYTFLMFFFFFFFSSRRRHTRFDCDWSSDVCSSDLGLIREWLRAESQHMPVRILDMHLQCPGIVTRRAVGRSEERRVGKECRSRWSPYH